MLINILLRFRDGRSVEKVAVIVKKHDSICSLIISSTDFVEVDVAHFTCQGG